MSQATADNPTLRHTRQATIPRNPVLYLHRIQRPARSWRPARMNQPSPLRVPHSPREYIPHSGDVHPRASVYFSDTHSNHGK